MIPGLGNVSIKSSSLSPSTSSPPLVQLPSSQISYLNSPISNKVVCKICHSPNSTFYEDFAAGDLICTECGAIVGDRIIDTRSEWRTFSNDNAGGDDPSRVGGPSNPLLDNENLDTMISSRDGNTGTSKELSKLQNRTGGAKTSSERNLIETFRNLTNLCERIGLPKNIADRAKLLYKQAHESKILRGKAREGMIGACIFNACREMQVSRSYKEISSLTGISKKDIGRCVKAMQPFLEKQSTPNIEDFMARFCSHLRLKIEVQKAAIFFARRIKELGWLEGKSPLSIASAGIFMVSWLFDDSPGRTAKDISFVSGVSENTIRSVYKDLYNQRASLVPPELYKNLYRIPDPSKSI